MSKPKVFSPREAESVAKRLGWIVEPKHASGAVVYRSPSGERFTAAAAGRADRVPLALAKALTAALDAHDKKPI